MCSQNSTCKWGYKKIKHWTGGGGDWYACEKVNSINFVWPGNDVAKPNHKTLVVSLGGSGASTDNDGFEWFCDNYMKPHKDVLCISSWGAITTDSGKLGKNIASLIDHMNNPKVILIGKSMGACKLHHAATGSKAGVHAPLKDKKIDLFIGIDMSCAVKRHFEKGEADPLWFTDNIKKLLVFYQVKADEIQTGHQGIFKGKPYDPKIHIDVNKDGFDLDKEARCSGPNICNNVGHMDIDDCKKLLETVRDIVVKRSL